MQLPSQQQAVSAEPNGKARPSVPHTSALTPIFLGAVLSVAAFTPGNSQVKPDPPTITSGSLAQLTERPLYQLQIPASDTKLASSTPRKRLKRGKSMSRRRGQTGSISINGKWWTVRFWMDKPGQEDRMYMREKICPTSGPGLLTASARERKAKEIIADSGADKEETLKETVASVLGATFDEQSETWLGIMRKRKAAPGRTASIRGFCPPISTGPFSVTSRWHPLRRRSLRNSSTRWLRVVCHRSPSGITSKW